MSSPPPEGPLDLLVLGSGVAGLTAAIRAATHHGLRVGVLTKGPVDRATTRWAQGGIAAVLTGPPDSTDLHLADTLAAGGGLCDREAVRVLVDEGPERVRELVALGARFDRDADGELELSREGGHQLARVVHAGGAATGVEVERALVAAVREVPVQVHEGTFVVDLLVEGGRCVGVRAVGADGRPVEVRAGAVLAATGGAGQVFAVTTNPAESTGDGIAAALRAGVAVADLEMVQFHPTALHVRREPRPLLSEALRGEGALIRDTTGARFVDELLPRDEVSRAMTRRMLELGVDHCWLDVTGLDRFAGRFPSLARVLVEVGLDPVSDWLPIAPAAHYLCGGIVTDLRGATTLPGLWAAGEVACSGVHGANRLASNSLLEGLVFGARAVDAVAGGVDGPGPTGAMRAVPGGPDGVAAIGGRTVEGWEPPGVRPVGEVAGRDLTEIRHRLQHAMTEGAGVLRDAASLEATSAVVAEVDRDLDGLSGPAAWELGNLVDVARGMLAAAAARTESRGAHTRADFPLSDPAQAHRLVLARP